ncbi:MAG: thioredoxin domain-containing protein [Kiritimatiellia bacterium]|nr:thioredoxin domain-containing protein [Kiritimatiellia bacterium]
MLLKQVIVWSSLVVFTAMTAGCLNGQKEKKEMMKTSEIVVLTDANFDTKTIKGVVLIDFWAPGCGPCLAQVPIIKTVATAMSGKAKIGKCNVDEAPKSAERFGIRSIPSLIILKDNQEVERFIGVQQEAELISAIKKHIK